MKKEDSFSHLYAQVPKVVMELLKQSRWHLKKNQSEIIREAIVNYIENNSQDSTDEELRQLIEDSKKALNLN